MMPKVAVPVLTRIKRAMTTSASSTRSAIRRRLSWSRIIAAAILIVSPAIAPSALGACPTGFNTASAVDGGLYLWSDFAAPLNTPSQFAPAEPEQRAQDNLALRGFYYMNRGAQAGPGAIAIKRIYVLADPRPDTRETVFLANNIDASRYFHRNGLNELGQPIGYYTAWHQDPFINPSHTIRDFYYRYRVGQQLQNYNGYALGFTFNIEGENALHKVLIITYEGVSPNGTCLDFELGEAATASREVLVEIVELNPGPDIEQPVTRVRLLLTRL